ncbi:MAG: hypothetical protein LKE53_07510 [Oscillospiraceae bacterium]|jgi:hypothetical protein|nr:hypothetical protein [Oscillospiraceae bacterium]MDD3261315.1 hypothetical protein [Oscillospiraceae bacterium]
MKQRRKNKIGLSLCVAFLTGLLSFFCPSQPAFGEEASAWKIGGRVTLLQHAASLTLQMDGNTVSFSGALCAACLEPHTDSVLLLMHSGTGTYLNLYCAGSAYTGSHALAAAAEVPALQACCSKRALFVRYSSASGQAEYSVQKAGSTAVCTAASSVPAGSWDSVKAVKTAQSVSSAPVVSSGQKSSRPSSSSSASKVQGSGAALKAPGAAESSGEAAASPGSNSALQKTEEAQLPVETVSQQASDAQTQSVVPSSALKRPSAIRQTASRLYRCGGPTTVAQLQQELLNLHGGNEKEKINVFTAEGKPVNTGYLTTGDQIQDYRNGTISRLTVIIPGDLCGSGHPDTASYALLRQSVAGGSQLSGLTAQAADMTQPGGEADSAAAPVLNTADLLLLKRAAENH